MLQKKLCLTPLVFLPFLLEAQPVTSWTLLAPTGTLPGPRDSANPVYSSASNRLMAFGGYPHFTPGNERSLDSAERKWFGLREKTMLDSRRLNQNLLESSTDCIKLLDLEARLLFMNGLGCKALEIDDFASVANTYWLDFWKGTFADAARAAIESAKTGGFGRFRGYCPTWKGTPKWWDVVITRLLDAHEKPEYLLVVSRDVTEHKLIEERLRASEGRLMEAQHLAKVGSWERHIKNDTIDWSEEMLRILGLTNCAPSNLQTFLSYVHPKDREKILEVDDQIRSSIAPVEVEYRIVRPDGEERFVRSIIEGIRDDQGVLVRITGATQDVTEQVKVRELLRESEQRLKSAQQLTHVGSWHWNLEADRVVCSEECLRIFGQPDDYAPSLEGLLEMIAPSERERVAGELRGGIAEKSGCATEFHIIRPNGELRAVSFTSQVLLDEKGSPQHIFGACQDVTDVRRAQEESISRQKLESIGTLASGIAHDFNNLLGGVLVQAEVALGELAAGLVPEEELKMIRDVAVRGSEVVRELMVYAGKESATLELVDVSRIIQEMLELLKVSVSKHAVLEVHLGKNPPPIRANAAQLRQIVMNLITNASDAIGDRDGVIRLSTRCVSVDQDSSGAIG